MSELLEAHTIHCGAARTDTLINALGSHPAVLTWALRCDLENRGITPAV